MELTFDQWFKRCDGVTAKTFGLGVDDLPDAPWRDYYEDGLSPRDAVECASVDYWDIEDLEQWLEPT